MATWGIIGASVLVLGAIARTFTQSFRDAGRASQMDIVQGKGSCTPKVGRL